MQPSLSSHQILYARDIPPVYAPKSSDGPCSDAALPHHIEVSADADRKLHTGDSAWLYPKDPVNPDEERLSVNAIVFEKADPRTRTFSIALMTRNERRKVEDIDPETRGLPLTDDFLPVVKRFKGEPGPLFVR